MDNIESVKALFKVYIREDIELKEVIEKVNFKLKYNDKKLRGELTTPYIEMLSEYQDSVYYAYLAITGRSENLNLLTNKEREALSLKFKVEEGSDIIKTALEDVNKLFSLAEKTVNKLNGTEILVAIAICAGYLSIDKISDTFIEIKKENNKQELEKAHIEREKRLYKTFEDVINRIDSSSTFERKKIEAIHKPLYAYDDNELETEEETINALEAQRIRKAPSAEVEKYKGLYLIDGLRGASENSKVTSFWFVDEDGKEVSYQFKNSELDIMRKNMLFQNIGNFVDLDLEITRVDGIIKKKEILSINLAI